MNKSLAQRFNVMSLTYLRLFYPICSPLALFLCFFLYGTFTKAQFVSARLGINGLTCSMCSYGVERELEKLPFVKEVTMDLNKNIADVVFINEADVNMKKVMEAVYNAGFSLGYTEADFMFEELSVYDGYSMSYKNNRYDFIKPSMSVLKGKQTLKFIDKKFISKKGYSFWKEHILSNDKKKSTENTSFVYHITL